MGIFDKFFKPPSQDKFVRQVMERIRRAGEKKQIVYDREKFSLSAVNGDGAVCFLGNIYAEYIGAKPADRPEIVGKVARLWFSHMRPLPESFDDARPDLLPTVRSRSYFEFFALESEIDGRGRSDLPYQIVGEHLAQGVVYDLPESMQVVRQEDLDGWGVTLYEALEAARENLLQLDHPFVGPEEDEGLYMSAINDGYGASRLMLPELVRQFRVKGEPIAMVPNRETLLVAGSDDPDALGAMTTLAREAIGQPRMITGMAFRLDGADWAPWLPPASHPHYRELKTLQVESLGTDYAEQKRLLDRLHENAGEDVFVASFGSIEPKGSDEVLSYSVWSNGVPTLLPCSDLVALAVGEGSVPQMARWDRLVEVAGHLMEPIDRYPTRYLVSDFPTPDELRAIGGVL